ncbi:venom protease isoform X2 [Rhipicephalus microplus]|uniref:venom protease isoform X2 n=1 Tax=Rhipicephalus microplus TaxID=6941 RepID=UPI003F6B6A93
MIFLAIGVSLLLGSSSSLRAHGLQINGPECGITTHEMIVNGSYAKPGQFPWMVFLVVHNRKGQSFQCGGTILTQRHILTAAHCIYPNGLVAVGAEAYYGNIHKRHGKRLRVTKVIPHAKYNEKSFSHDIAVFVVEKPFQFGTNARPICIPTAPVNIAGTDNIVAGWGFIREGGPGTHLLKYTTVTVQPNHICYADYRGFDSRVMYCAYKTATDSCQGDSGGPAMYRVSGGHRYVEVGIVSYGHGCARENVPGVYTRVDVFAPWLKQVVGSYDRAYTTAVPMPLGLSTVSESPLSIQFL